MVIGWIQFRLKMLNFWNWNGKTLRALLIDFELKRKPGHMRLTFPWRKMDWNSNAKRKSVFTSFQLSSIMPQQYTNSKVSYQLVAASWSKTKNCAYVVLSRVLSLDGLFLMDSWNPSWNPLICALWPGFLDLCTWTTGTVQSLKMVSLIGFHVICAHLCTWSTGIILV